jgi:hypothetical protein
MGGECAVKRCTVGAWASDGRRVGEWWMLGESVTIIAILVILMPDYF